jgi:hypothetical protein
MREGCKGQCVHQRKGVADFARIPERAFSVRERGLGDFQAAATASRHVVIAAVRSTR